MCDRCDTKLSWAVGKKRVLSMGTTTIDFVSTVKQFPEDNNHERAIAGYWQRGGNASNISTVLRNLGVNVEFLGMLSSLQIYQILVDDMKSRGIIVENCPTCNQSAPFNSVILTKSENSRTIVNCNNDFPFVSVEDFRKLDLNKYGWIHMRALVFGTTMTILKDLAEYNASRETKIVISLEIDQNMIEMFPLLDYCDYAFFSKQLAQDHGWTSLENACLLLDERLRMRWGLNLSRPFVVVLWGDQGAGLMDPDGNFTHEPPYKPKRIAGTLGAGDTFIGAFIYAKYIRERSVRVAVDFANRIASYKCTRIGYDHIARILLPPVF